MSDLFYLDFSRWEILLLSSVPAFINLGIFLYVSVFLPHNRTNSSFSAFVFLLGIWQLGEGFVRLSRTEETALEWYRISGAPVAFILSFGIFFVLRFTKWNKRMPRNLKSVLLFFPAMICAFLIVARLSEYTTIKSPQGYWVVNPEPTIINSIIYLWLSLGALLMLALLWIYYLKGKGNKAKRKQSLLLAAGFSVPVTGGIILEVIFPLLLGINSVPVTNSLMTVFSIASLVAIRKYKMLEYSPRHQWDKIMESMNEGVLIADKEDRIMYANKMLCHLVGYEFEEIKGKITNQLFHDNEEDREKIRKALIEREHKISAQYEIQLKKKTGEKIWVLASGSPYMDEKGKITGSIAILTNIDSLKQTEYLLRNREEILHDTVAELKRVAEELKEAQTLAHVGNWELDFATNKAIWSDEACRIYGLSPCEKEQSFESWIAFIHPEDLDAVNKEVEKSRSALCDSSLYHRIVCKDGTVKHVHSVSKFKFNSEGKPVGIYGMAVDVTELKKAEEKLKASNEELKTFIYKSSHDLRAPLASVLGLINVANMELTDPKALEYINSIGEMTRKLDAILLKLVRSMSVKTNEISMEPVDMRQLLAEILNSLKHIEGFDKIKFNIDNRLTAPIQTNRDSIYSVMLNLTENSIKYRKQGCYENEINIRMAKDEKGSIVIEVADNGIGIREEAKDKVFKMFYRATNISKGSGLGLYLVKTTVEKLGGNILLESKEKLGTKFTVHLPGASN